MESKETPMKKAETKVCAACGREFTGEYCGCQNRSRAAIEQTENSNSYGTIGLALIVICILAAIVIGAFSTRLIGVVIAAAFGGIIIGLLFMALGRIIVLLEKIALKK